MEQSNAGGLANASPENVTQAIDRARDDVAARWQETLPVPPPVIWERKCAEAAELAKIALSHRDNPLSDQHSWAEIPFGGDKRAEALDAHARSFLPWDPMAQVNIPGTSLLIGGSIDRLDLSGDRGRARVTDYKSGRQRGRPPQLKGGAELQRCLYAYAVKALVTGGPDVEAQLLYPRRSGQGLLLDSPEATLAKLTAYLTAATASFAAGNAIPGPAADEEWYDFAFALPGGAKEVYLATIRPLVAQALDVIAPLWDETVMPDTSPPTQLPDAAARLTALTEHDLTLLVEAGAGSGKTALIAGRVALLIAAGIPPREIVAITFTEAAASELLERIELFVEALRADELPPELRDALPHRLTPSQRGHLEAGARALDEITCTTIHGFCQQLVKPYPVEARIDPGAAIIDPAAAEIAYQDLMDAWLSARFGRDRAAEGLGRIPPIANAGGEDDFFTELLVNEPDKTLDLISKTAGFLKFHRTARATDTPVNAATFMSLAECR